jgi:hypothetical protein
VINGVVTGANGPEAGVWVIAETRDLPTLHQDRRHRRSGALSHPRSAQSELRHLGARLRSVDSPKTKSRPARPQPEAVRGAQRDRRGAILSAIYWYSMLKIPTPNLSRARPAATASRHLARPGLWLRYLKTDGCNSCHQLGDKSTRELEPQARPFRQLGASWERRIQSGQAGVLMVQEHRRFRSGPALANFGDWTDRIAKGELPFAKPSRPPGIEAQRRADVWDWSTPTLHARSRLRPTAQSDLNRAAHLTVARAELGLSSRGSIRRQQGRLIKTEWRDPKTPTTKTAPIYAPSPYWGNEPCGTATA